MKKSSGGRARIGRKYIYFNEEGWALVLKIAKKRNKSPKFVVNEALKQAVKQGLFK